MFFYQKSISHSSVNSYVGRATVLTVQGCKYGNSEQKAITMVFLTEG